MVTDLQLYLAIGIPTFGILIGILTNVVRHNVSEARFNLIETRLNNLDFKFEGRFNNLDVKFDTLTGKVIDLDNRVTRVEAKLGIS